MDGFERRRHRRLGASFDLSCRKVGIPAEQFCTGCTVNVAPGGLYFEATETVFEPGDLAEVRLSVPPTASLLERGGMIAGPARVLRTDNLRRSHIRGQLAAVQGVAVEFCRPPKLCI